MNDVELKDFVNDLELRCTHCDGNVSITNMTGDSIALKHNLPIVGEKQPSNETKCMFYDGEVKRLTNAFRNSEINAPTLRENLIELSRK